MKEKKIEVIENLKKSKTFPKNELTFKILYHLVEEEEAQRRVKSSTIAIDLFGIQNSYNGTNQDSYVRNKLFNIRKELNLYYLSEGVDDKYRLSIPKGEYKVKIEEQKPRTTLNRKKKIIIKKRMNFLIAFVVGFLLAGIIFFLLPSTTVKQDKTKSSLVSLLINRSKAIDIIIGNRAFYYEYDTTLKRRRYVFDTDVELPTSMFKMNELLRKCPDRKIVPNVPFYHADIENMLLAMKLDKEYTDRGTDVEIVMANNISKLEHDAIFISKLGSGELYNLSSYFSNSKMKHDNVDRNLGIPTGRINRIQINDTTEHMLVSRILKQNILKSFTSHYLIKKVKTSEGHSLLFLLAGRDGERKYINKKLFEEEFQKEIIDSFDGDIPEEFELLIKSIGSDRIAYKHKVVYNNTWDEEKQLRVFNEE